MKVLFIKSRIHHKNLHFILNCKRIHFYIINSVNDIINIDLSQFDAVYSPCEPINVKKYPNTKFIFGPQFSVFPENNIDLIKGQKTVYNLLSNWVVNIWKQFPVCNNLKLIVLPFGVDTEKFIDNGDIKEKKNVMIYFKHRNPSDLYYIENFLKYKNIKYSVFSYDKKYDETDYINYLQNSKYCIWIDAHESQGFALQEALSCNVPLLVWNITSMNQEYMSNYSNLPATTTSYWDNKCGELFYNINEFEITYNKFIKNLNNYKPREFIIDNLSIDVCENKLIEVISNM
jgi:hypothetical protein